MVFIQFSFLQKDLTDSFADLNGILTDSASSFHHFKYSTSEGEGVYKFYESRNDNVPFIIVNVKDGKVVSFSTFYNGNTYVTTITALSAE